MQQPIVYVIDDDPSMRSAVCRLLASAGLEALPFASGQEFLDYSRPEGPACLVLDVRMPGLTGLELQEELSAAGEVHSIVFMTAHSDLPAGIHAMKAGAVDFLLKPFDDQDLLDAVKRALASATESYAARVRAQALRERLTSLTPRERDVLSLVVAGRLNKQIAQRLGIGEKTVKVHRAHLIEKMGASSVAELVRMVLRARGDVMTDRLQEARVQPPHELQQVS